MAFRFCFFFGSVGVFTDCDENMYPKHREVDKTEYCVVNIPGGGGGGGGGGGIFVLWSCLVLGDGNSIIPREHDHVTTKKCFPHETVARTTGLWNIIVALTSLWSNMYITE